MVLGGCFDPDPMDVETSSLIAKTVPSDAVVLERQEPKRDRSLMTASWSFQWRGDWASYLDWVKGSLGGGFSVVKEDGSLLTFKRDDGGDALSLVIEHIDSTSEFRVTLIGSPW
jgi:hypothetical protein